MTMLVRSISSCISTSCILRNISQPRLVVTRNLKKAYPSGPVIAPKPYIHPAYLRRKFNEDPEIVLRILKIEPNESLSGSLQFRVGNKGSICINREENEGFRKGSWYNFETLESGDMFDLAKASLELSDNEMVTYAMEHVLPHLREDSENDIMLEGAIPPPPNLKKKVVENYANQLFSELVPLEGSPAEEYLKLHRKIRFIKSSYLKYHPNVNSKANYGGVWLNNLPALVAIASHPNSTSMNLQVTYLNPETKNKHQDVAISKKTLGTFNDPLGFHSCEICPNVHKKISFVCEGVETALSVNQAFPEDHIIATLGKHNFTNVDPNILNNKVVLVFDNDGVGIDEDRVFHIASRRLIEAGKNVYIVCPPLIEGFDKTDMNDVLVQQGEQEVYEIVVKHMKKVIK